MGWVKSGSSFFISYDDLVKENLLVWREDPWLWARIPNGQVIKFVSVGWCKIDYFESVNPPRKFIILYDDSLDCPDDDV